jgi:hypothetical protein
MKWEHMRVLAKASTICYTAPMISPYFVKGDSIMNPTAAFRVSPWVLVALVTVLVLLTMTAIALSQSGMLHTISAALQGGPSLAPICGTSGGNCP